jgi:tripartite-type tricarboxylate transporter receptor subunit TctC
MLSEGFAMNTLARSLKGHLFVTHKAVVFATWAAVALMPTVWAADPVYPVKPIKLVVPFSAGATADIVARMFGERLSARLGQPVLVDNKSGAGGVIGVDSVAKAAPDGYTLLLTTSSTVVINPSLYNKLPYDVDKDLTPVAVLGSLSALLVANPSLPVNNVAELVRYARMNPGKLNYASNGIGSYAHVMMELLKHSTGMEVEHIPYRGGSSADTDLLAGNVQLMFNSVAVASTLAASGRLKALAVSSAQRSRFAPSVPGMGESGMTELKNYDVTYWVGILAPAGTPSAIVRALNMEANDWLISAEAVEKLTARKILPSPPTTPKEITKQIRTETVYWAKVLKDAKVELQSY